MLERRTLNTTCCRTPEKLICMLQGECSSRYRLLRRWRCLSFVPVFLVHHLPQVYLSGLLSMFRGILVAMSCPMTSGFVHCVWNLGENLVLCLRVTFSARPASCRLWLPISTAQSRLKRVLSRTYAACSCTKEVCRKEE